MKAIRGVKGGGEDRRDEKSKTVVAQFSLEAYDERTYATILRGKVLAERSRQVYSSADWS